MEAQTVTKAEATYKAAYYFVKAIAKHGMLPGYVESLRICMLDLQRMGVKFTPSV